MSAVDDPEGDGAGLRARALLDEAAEAADAARGRLSAAALDLFRPEHHRLSDFQRSTMRAILVRLVDAIELDLRRALLDRPAIPGGDGFREALAGTHDAIALPMLERAGLLGDPALVALLLRRADEYRLGRLLGAGAVADTPGSLDTLDQGDAEIAEAAMAVRIAESRRNDRLDEPGLDHADLPAELQHRLVWSVAAALRDFGARDHGVEAAALDRALTACAGAILARHDEGATLEAASLRLAQLLRRAGRLDDTLLAGAFAGGRPALYAAALAARAGIGFDEAWEMAADPGQARHAVLLRATGVGREVAAGLLFAMHAALGEDGEAVAGLIAGFDALDEEGAREAIRHWRLDAEYREALAALAVRKGRGA